MGCGGSKDGEGGAPANRKGSFFGPSVPPLEACHDVVHDAPGAVSARGESAFLNPSLRAACCLLALVSIAS